MNTRSFSAGCLPDGHIRRNTPPDRTGNQHRIKPVIAGTYAFDKAPEAFAHLKRGAFGKVVIEVQPAR
jgi:hypothetical protein